MPLRLMSIHSLRLVGGMAVLDFLNSCNGRRPGTSLGEVAESLLTLEDVIYWFQHANLISTAERDHLLALIPASSYQQNNAYQQMIAFREQLYGLFFPIAEGHRITPAALDSLNKALVDAAPYRQLALVEGATTWVWCRSHTLEEVIASLIGRLAVQAASLLTSPELARLKLCSTLACDWLFLDTSKNGRRRWCQMSICGSREKAKRASTAYEPVE
ncbi:CGNR zinc finger domain-containing protein [Pseudomonas sp. RTC3]|uniref:CGNR zinc finger domain-containing protein n=1 Tax=unclassified Pseudomonas TaxID=196821 RepID=UPI002AB4B3E9|nr:MULTISPECIES: ABATE domain-containing protein [unclassified Pseudomonas]MEB0061135.1 CGNR zinc finger domain-containing protein [Pseudomonas sp. RTC3]MDY7565623.1 CGNR zinc finger domain-containing protein [Pseudomonas sp. 5C2]MEB0006213.1 CGNR zinc finger domain-containing protein [Pseudomonas sp. RTB2]MEB0015635.1 CGNR zinc finger domain-containing protein [Pseudomonas sp. RTB3]MEB0025644.1 CGNR zinc finger domain-containing protein [Pseudomonas sp. MH9.2]